MATIKIDELECSEAAMKNESNPLLERFLLGFELGWDLGSQNGLRREQHLILRQLKKRVKKLSETAI